MPRWWKALAVLLVLGWPARGLAGETKDLEALRRQIDALQQRIEAQQRQVTDQADAMRRQQDEIQRLSHELTELTAKQAALADTKAPAAPAPAAAAPPSQTPPSGSRRDAVGDLNAEAVAAGDFPGSIRIPGTDRVSIAIGGFVKTVAIGDSDLEGAGPIFLPAMIGSSVPDESGNMSIDGTLSRLTLDARGPIAGGSLRGYFEVDLNATNSGSPGFNLRHAYGAWASSHGTLTFGHTWSTAMDLQILPEGLTEPTVSGAIFQRQAQIRWTQPVSPRVRVDLAIEDPTNRDVISDAPLITPSRLPDFIAGTEVDWPSRAHVRVTGIYRHVNTRDLSANAWALSTGAHLMVFGADKIAGSLSYGDGVGRYLLGMPGTFGGFVDPGTGDLELIAGRGGFLTYRHAWADKLRSTVGYGRAGIDRYLGAPDDEFRRSAFVLANLMVSPLPYLTYGFEYQYGAREAQDGSTRDNHRFIFGIQVF